MADIVAELLERKTQRAGYDADSPRNGYIGRGPYCDTIPDPLCQDAAAEITRLRALVQRSCTHHSRLFNPSGGWQCPLCDARGPA